MNTHKYVFYVCSPEDASEIETLKLGIFFFYYLYCVISPFTLFLITEWYTCMHDKGHVLKLAEAVLH